MKKFVVLLAGLMLIGLSASVLAQEAIPTYYAVGIPDDKIPTIDGDLSDWAWVPSEYVVEGVAAHMLLPPEDADDMSATFWYAWSESENRVYGAIHVHDADIMLDLHPQSPHVDDSIELFFDPLYTGEHPYRFADDVHSTSGGQFWISAQETGPKWGCTRRPIQLHGGIRNLSTPKGLALWWVTRSTTSITLPPLRLCTGTAWTRAP